MLIDEYLPDYNFSERHTIDINASKDQVFKAIIDLSPNEISIIFRLLFLIRSIPPKMLGRNYIDFDPNIPLLKQLEDKGFKILETNEQEIVFGVIGQLGKLKNGEIYQLEDFKNFNENESGKVVTNFYLMEKEKKVSLSTETRIHISGKKSKKLFAMYWMIVYPGSALIRRIWLKAIKKRAKKNRVEYSENIN